MARYSVVLLGSRQVNEKTPVSGSVPAEPTVAQSCDPAARARRSTVAFAMAPSWVMTCPARVAESPYTTRVFHRTHLISVSFSPTERPVDSLTTASVDSTVVLPPGGAQT